MVQHLAGVLHEHQGDHQRQALRHGADDDDDSQGHRLNDILDDIRRGRRKIRPEAAGLQDKVAKVHDGDDNGADIAEGGDLLGQLGQLHLQGGVRLVLLHLFGHFAHHGGKADLLHVHHALAVEQDGPPEEGVGIDKRIAGDVIGQLRALGGGGLGTFLGLAVQGGVVHAQVAGNQNTVSGDFIAGL